MLNISPAVKAYASVNGIQMYYELHGAGDPLVLIHGGGSTIDTTFGRILPVLAQKYKCIAVEMQAHGRSSDRDVQETFQQDAADIAELLRQLNIDRAYILGFSNGGQTGLQLAIDQPQLIRKLIIASAFYARSGVPPQFWEGMDHAKFSDMPQPLKDAFLELGNKPDALLNMFNRDVQRMQNFRDWPKEALQSISMPVLVMSGDHDVASPDHAAEMFSLIPNAQLAILPGGHGAYLGEITTLENGSWVQDYAVNIITQFLDAKL
jgi:pimeloyl-ACP methyl ester carboxylesterase